MINLRYHIVSLTAVFLAIGIGLTLGSTFLDRATVENLDGQLNNLQGRLEDREGQINELDAQVADAEALQTALDEQAIGLLTDRVEGVPVVVMASRGVDESDVRGAVQALVVAGADVRGLWWFTDRWALDDEAEIEDLAVVLDESTTDPSRLRRMAIDALGGELRARQLLTQEEPEDDAASDDGTGTGDDPAEDGVPGPGEPGGDAPLVTDAGNDAAVEIVAALTEGGFIEFEPVPGGPEEPGLPDGSRLLIVGGSPTVPDDLVMGPLVARMGRATTTPVLAVASSALDDDGELSDLVSVIRQDEQLRDVIPTVDDLEHFAGWAAMILALRDVGEIGEVGHYGIDDTATRLLPPLRAP